MNTFKWIFPSVFLILSYTVKSSAQVLPYLDSQFTCIGKAQADKYQKDFNVDLKSFGGQELCRPEIDFKKLSNDLSIIEFGQFDSSRNGSLIGQFVNPSQYYQWMRSETRGMERGNDIPTATAYNRGGYFTMQDGWSRLSTLGRVGTVIHEARHTEGYRHIRCTFGPYSDVNMDGCDKNFNYGGSHAVEMEYYARVSLYGKNFHPVYKAMARLMAMARSNFVFNSSPMEKREGLLVQSDNGSYWLLDNNKWFYRPALTPQSNLESKFRSPVFRNGTLAGVLKRTSFGATIFNGFQAFAIDLYERFEPTTALTDTYSYYKILLDLKTNLKDFEEFDIGIKRHLVQITPQNQMSSFNYGRGRWNSYKALNFQPSLTATALPNGSTGYFIVDTQEKIYAYDPKKDAMIPTSYTWDTQAASYANVNSQIFSLTKGQKLYTLNNGVWSELALPQNQKPIQMTAVPLYNVFSVKD